MTSYRYVVLTHAGDVHYCRALLASIRHAQPSAPVLVIVDGPLRDPQLGRWEQVEVVRSRDLADQARLPLTGYLAKLNLLYLDSDDHLIYMDADSILLGDLIASPLLEAPADIHAIQGEWVDLDDPQQRASFAQYSFDPDRIVAEVDPTFEARNVVQFWSGNFVMRAGAIPPRLLEQNLEHISRNWERERPFHLNDQSFLSYAVNKGIGDETLDVEIAQYGLIGRDTQAEHPEITIDAVLAGQVTDHYVIHYTGPCRKTRLRDHEYSDVLLGFLDLYYRDLPRWARPLDEAKRFYEIFSRRLRRRIAWSIEHRRLRG